MNATIDPEHFKKIDDLARFMYDQYCLAVGGIAFNGDKLPSSEEFFADPNKTKQSTAWIVLADSTLTYISCRGY